MSLGIFLQNGDQAAGGAACFGGGIDMIQHLLAQAFAAMFGGYQQQADIGIIGVGKAEGNFGHCDKIVIQHIAEPKAGGGVNAGWGVVEEAFCLAVIRGLARFEQDMIGSPSKQVGDTGGIGGLLKGPDHRTTNSKGS